MTAKQTGEADMMEAVRARIRAAFPDVAYCGQITPVDDNLTDEDYDEERDLFRALHGKRWSEISVPILKPLTHSLPLLSEEAFRAFLPAWLCGALDDPEMREPLVVGFCQDRLKEDTSFMDGRLQPLTSSQKEALRVFFDYLLAAGSSDLERGPARRALEYVDTFS